MPAPNTARCWLQSGLPGPGSTGFFTADRWGYTLGAGIEYAFNANWSAKLEYIHYGFDTEVAPAGTLASAPPTATTLRVDTVKLGVNYRFLKFGLGAGLIWNY